MPSTSPFASAFPTDGSALTPAQILAFHRIAFGDVRMDETGGEGGAGAEGADAAAAAAAAAEAATAAAAAASAEQGFPANTPWRDMTGEQQVAYWQHQARKHETTSKNRQDYDAIKAENEKLKAATQSDADKAIEAAKREASTETASKYQTRLVQAELKAELKGRIPADQIAGHVEFLDATKFLAADGEVDTDKVQQYAAGLVPAGARGPDMGQGRRGGNAPAKGVSAGADLFAASRGKKTT